MRTNIVGVKIVSIEIRNPEILDREKKVMLL